MTTASDIINQALKDAGIIASGETADASTFNDAADLLNQMIGQWQVDKVCVPGQHQQSVAINGSQTYTVGPGATVDVPLPVTVDSAFYRLGSIDYPVTVLDSFEDYESITLKTITGTLPDVVFYQRSYPTGSLYVWPQPNSGTLNLVLRDVLPTYSDTTADISVPAEYALAMRFSLAELLIVTFSMPQRPDIERQAAKARKKLKRNNLSVPMMGQPQELLNNGRFSIYSGQ